MNNDHYDDFLVILPILGFKEKTIPLPMSIIEPVLGGAPIPSAVKKKENLE